MADAPASPPPVRRPPGRTGLGGRRTLALAVGVAAIIAGLTGWLLAGGPGAAVPGRHTAGPAPVSASPTAPRLAEVNQATLIGQPVSTVRRQLRQRGLRVQVTWRYNGHQQPGTVIFVQPTGRLPAGTTVAVTGALAPPGHRGGHGNGGGNDQGNGNGDGQGD
jgi:serine/threonine-protein kinase